MGADFIGVQKSGQSAGSAVLVEKGRKLERIFEKSSAIHSLSIRLTNRRDGFEETRTTPSLAGHS